MSRLAKALIFGIIVLAPLQPVVADPNEAHRPYKIPATAGATLNRLIAAGQASGGGGTLNDVSVSGDEKRDCTQIVGGLVLDETSTVNGDVEINTFVDGSAVNVCR